MIYVISDLHGYPFEEFLKLLGIAEFSDNDKLYILGDVVDKGEDGIEYLRWSMKQPNVTLILGNHEDFLRRQNYLFTPNTDNPTANLRDDEKELLEIIMEEGGNPTIEGLLRLPATERMEIGFYLWTLPVYMKLKIKEKEFILVHAGLGNFRPDKPILEYGLYELIFERPALTDRYYDNITTVFGHTPTWAFGKRFEGKIIFTDTWIDIDVGAGYGCSPVLLRLDDMKQFRIP